MTGTSVQIMDLRSRARAGGSDRAHAMPARDVDFNPKRRHLLVTAGDDCRVRFWDERNFSGPVMDLVRGGGKREAPCVETTALGSVLRRRTRERDCAV